MKQCRLNKKNGIAAIAWLSSLIAALDGKEYIITVKEYRQRSLDANAYCWVLIDKLAAVMYKDLRKKRTDLKQDDVKKIIYKNAIKEIGGVSEIVCAPDKSLDKLRKAWEIHGLGWQSETFPSKLDGWTNVILYYGSSIYDTKQMSRLIDNIVQDCKAVGIETMTPRELEALKQEWK